MSNYQLKPTEVVTGEVRFSYVKLTKPDADGKYSCTILLPKSDIATKSALVAAIEAAKQSGASIWNEVIPPIVHIPVYDGDGVRPSDGLPFGEECRGHWVFTAKTNAEYPVNIVDANMQKIIDPTKIYSGMYGRIALSCAPYSFNGKKGVGIYINSNIMKTRDGEPLGFKAPEASVVFGVPAQTVPPQYQGIPAQAQYQQVPMQQYQPSVQPAQSTRFDPITGAPIYS